jgi:hypothetical protein
MSSHTVKSLNYQLNNIAECVIEYKENLRKTLVQIKVLKAQAKKAPKDFKYIYRDAIKELDMDVKQHKRNVKEAIKDAKKLRSKLPAAIAYEKKHPEAAGEAGYERERRLHLDKIRGKAVMASRSQGSCQKNRKSYRYPYLRPHRLRRTVRDNPFDSDLPESNEEGKYLNSRTQKLRMCTSKTIR